MLKILDTRYACLFGGFTNPEKASILSFPAII